MLDFDFPYYFLLPSFQTDTQTFECSKIKGHLRTYRAYSEGNFFLSLIFSFFLWKIPMFFKEVELVVLEGKGLSEVVKGPGT